MRALLSVSDKTGIEEFASGLTSRGYELISTGGTARTLRDAGLPITLVSEITGMPEMMDGRVKTLHPNIHAGILARRDHETDLSSLQEYDIEPIDLVVVNLYPFARTAANKSVSVSELIEQIDIGGPSLVRAAAKNFKDVLVIVDSGDYEETLLELDRSDGPELAFRLELSRKAFAHTAEYDTTIANTFESIVVSGTDFRREQSSPAEVVPDRLTLDLPRISTLRYGENPHQEAAWYGDSKGIGLPAAHQVQGKPLSFTNLIDLDAATRIVLEFEEPAAAVIKHTNPCGVATSATITSAYRQARDADALSAFGGIVGLNRPLDSTMASEIVSTFIEAVVAPSIDEAAKSVLAEKKSLRVLTFDMALINNNPIAQADARSILGGWVVQHRDEVREARSVWGESAAIPDLRVVTQRTPRPEEWTALQFAWRVCAHVKSNAVIFTRGDRTVAIGAGQMSRIDAVKVATLKAPTSLTGTVAASDAFFPFRDGLDALATAGATAVVQPGGSVRDAEVISAADEHGLAMVFTGRRHFRH